LADAGFTEEDDRRAGRTVRCPTLFLWSSRDDMEDLYGDPLAVWQPWVDDLRGASIDSGHHVAEENPSELRTALIDFLNEPAARLEKRSGGLAP
jgi:haloacetate dehalogenase